VHQQAFLAAAPASRECLAAAPFFSTKSVDKSVDGSCHAPFICMKYD
jgi:hypothetical protein